MLDQTTQADDYKKRTGGLGDWTGSFSFRLQFSDDTSVAQSAWQLLNHAFTSTDDDLKADLRLVLQSYQLSSDCDIFQTTIADTISLRGTVVIGDISMNCEDPEQPIVAVASWEADGALLLQRGDLPVQIAPCIAVIDETTPGLATQTADWNNFRAAWPRRPFYTLVPDTSTSSVISPTGYDGVKALVNRDSGDVANRSDWFEICSLGDLATGQPVFLFVDNSGSMTTATVQASYDLFLSKCAVAGLPIYSVTEADERYIRPFINVLVPV
jgi:hypothetical protein